MIAEELARIQARAMETPGPWTTQGFEGLLAQNGTFLVPSSNGVGFALGRVVLDEAEFLTLAIDPAHRRKGLGRACLGAFEEEAVTRGAGKLHLEVAETNMPAIGLYRSAGWTETGCRKAYYKGAKTRIDAILMTKRPDAG